MAWSSQGPHNHAPFTLVMRGQTNDTVVSLRLRLTYIMIEGARLFGEGLVRNAPVIAKLAAVADLREADIEKLVALCDDERIVPPRRDILAEGERPNHVHVIFEGWAARYKTLPNGSRQIVAFLIPGDFCDLHAGILGYMDHGIVALTRCRVAYVPSAKLDALTSGHDRLAKAMWWATLEDEGVLREWIVNVGRRDAFQRIAHLFCELHARMEMVGLVQDDQLALPLTQDQLADATGLTAVHVNRTLQRLRNENLIELNRGMLTILNVDALREAAGFNGNYLHIKRRVVIPR
jgi:CRP-like cAMP-binding protein